MSLRVLAEQDLGAILEDSVTGFGWAVTVTDPAGSTGTGPLTGFSDDIAQIIDPDTGQAVSGHLVSVALRISSLTTAGLGLPQGTADSTLKPWLVAFDDINGNAFTFKVAQSNPDRAIGIVTLVLELYQP